jgi:type II secretory pathway pseudopilin PulG
MIPLVENHSMHGSSGEPRIMKPQPRARHSFRELWFRQSGRMGFTSIELLVVIAIIAILIALLVPAVQKVRESAAHRNAANHLMEMSDAVQDYQKAHGHLPADLKALGDENIREVMDGYVFNLEGKNRGYLIRAVPFLPGKTGSRNMTIDEKSRLQESESPGANAVTVHMLQNINKAGLAAVSTLLQTDANGAAHELKTLVGSMAAHVSALGALDANGDGHVSVLEILNVEANIGCDIVPDGLRASSAPTVLGDFLNFLRAEMALGEGGENINLIPAVAGTGE